MKINIIKYNDASIKTLLGVKVSRTDGYVLDGTYLAGDINPDNANYRCGFSSVIQRSGRMYIQHMDTDSSRNFTAYNIDGKYI